MVKSDNDIPPKVVTDICGRFGLTITQQLTLGNICNSIYRVMDKNQQDLVLKVGTTEKTIAEIQRNKLGYEKMDQLGLASFRPNIVVYEDTDKSAILLMEYCGKDFFTQVKTLSDPVGLYRKLISEIEIVYNKSLGKGPEGNEMVLSVIKKIKEQYNIYIHAQLDPHGSIAERISRLETIANIGSIDSRCFSNWDFTPEDVYLTPKGIKYSDPHEDILGIPIIDLACFAGVAVVYQLPGSTDGYNLLKNFAIQKVSSLFGIDKNHAYRIFYLGRLLQCFLSARFSLKADMARATSIFSESKSYLEKILQNP